MQRLEQLALVAAALLAVVGTAACAGEYVRDTPYRELVPQRFLFKNQKPIADFNQLSFNAVDALVGCSVHDSDGWLLATELGLTWFTRQNVNKQIPLDQGSINWQAATILCAGSNNVYIVDDTTAYSFSIDDSLVGAERIFEMHMTLELCPFFPFFLPQILSSSPMNGAVATKQQQQQQQQQQQYTHLPSPPFLISSPSFPPFFLFPLLFCSFNL